jgi:hypothetical protein
MTHGPAIKANGRPPPISKPPILIFLEAMMRR